MQHGLEEAERLIAAGDQHFEAQEFGDAEPLYCHAITLREAALGEMHEAIAVALNRLANVYYQQHNDEKAGELFARALAIREAVLPPNAPELRLSVNNLANAYRNQERFAEAEPLYRRSLAMRERETGHPNHPAIWKNLLRVLEGQGKTAEAELFSQKIREFESTPSV